MSRHTHPQRRSRIHGALLWAPGLAVALGAAVATAHGLYEVAAGAGVARPIAWLYPLITDGLALVAYAATARLDQRGRRYAWCVVVLAAGLSGLAQAGKASGWVGDASPALRFGVGAWPAVAAAIVAHLLFMLGAGSREHRAASSGPGTGGVADARASVGPGHSDVQAGAPGSVQPDVQNRVQPSVQPAVQAGVQFGDAERPPSAVPVQPRKRSAVQSRAESGARSAPVGEGRTRDRARAAARGHAARHGSLPTVNQLAAIAEVSRGTAGNALKELREQQPALQVVHDNDEASTS